MGLISMGTAGLLAGMEGNRAPLVVAAQAGETVGGIEREVTDVYRDNAAALFRYVLSIVRDRAIAEEAVQETFFRYYLARVRGDINPVGRLWLFRVARNYVLDRVKECAFRNMVSLEQAGDLPELRQNPEADYQRSELEYRALRLLAPRELECLQLRMQGFRYREIALLLGVNCGTVGTMLNRGLRKIRGTLQV
jgi:RNA polymerase sigma-70 factor (ECF subfamily)